MAAVVLVRGGGDLASGVILRLFRMGLQVVVTELAQPLAVRRLVSFCEAVYSGEITIEGVTGRLAASPLEAVRLVDEGIVPVMVDPGAGSRFEIQPLILIDARMTKQAPDMDMSAAPLVIGLGPGFEAGRNCHAVIETRRGPYLGRVIWSGQADADTGLPEVVISHREDRVLRAARAGVFTASVSLGDIVEQDQEIACIDGEPIRARFRGVVRGLIESGIIVTPGLKVGDIDPRSDPRLARLVSDKSLAVAGGVMEAVLSQSDIRSRLWLG